MADSLPATMAAVLLTGHGSYDCLSFSQVPRPVARRDEVVVRLGGAAVNNTDINLRTGWYAASGRSGRDAAAGWMGDRVEFPRIQGADGAGRIVAVGADVDASRVGERVLIDPIFRRGDAVQYFGSDTPGAFAEYVAVPSANAVSIHSTLSDPELASFPCSYLAALHMVSRAAVRRDQTVLVTGASGGVGSAAVQWCRARGARVYAIADARKHAALNALGAERVLARDASLVSALGVHAVDAVLDVVGGAAFGELLEVLRPQGHYAVAGAIGGPLVTLDLRTAYLKDLTLHGCTIPPVPLFAELVSAIERGALRPLVAAAFPLRDLAAAQRAFECKAHLGKIVIVPG